MPRSSDIDAKITDEGVARLRQRIGIPMPDPVPVFLQCPNADAVRHWPYA